MKNIFVLLLLFTGSELGAQTLTSKIAELIKNYNADVGVAVITTGGDTLSVNGNKAYPMQSVYKFHLALKILSMTEAGKLSLNQEVVLTKRDLLPGTWSPLRDSFYVGARVPLKKIIYFTVAHSDNNGCDILFRLCGGPKAVHDFIQAQGVSNTSIVFTEEEMHADWQNQFSNTTTPLAMVRLLDKFYKGEILSQSNTKLLLDMMFSTTTGANRLKAKLPGTHKVAHKTGTSGYQDGVSAACNDAGIITIPGNRFYLIAVFVGKSTEKHEVNEEIIAKISELVLNNMNLN